MSGHRFATVAFALVPLLLAAHESLASDLTFEDRVRAQEAIERVYYSHQIGATEPFEEAVPRSVLEAKVRTYLKESAALETYWNTSVTAEALARELERIKRNTRIPDRLREIDTALGNDPQLLLECLARPALVDRLARNFFAYDRTIHRPESQQAQALRDQLVSGLIPTVEHPLRTVKSFEIGDPAQVLLADSATTGSGASSLVPGRMQVKPDEYSQLRSGAPDQVGATGPVTEERDAFVIRIVIDESAASFTLASYAVPKVTWDTWWDVVKDALPESTGKTVALDAGVSGLAINSCTAKGSDQTERVSISDRAPVLGDAACGGEDSWERNSLSTPDPRVQHAAVWTGSLMLVWGGTGGTPINTGGRYDPVTDTWTVISVRNAPAGRSGFTAVWTGASMIVWGGSASGAHVNTGGRYDPASDTWTPTSIANAPSARAGHTAVWTGEKMLVWGGGSSSFPEPRLNTGGQYDPRTDSWTPISLIGAPTPRYFHTGVWTGTKMVVWGGFGGAQGDPYTDTGGQYDPVADTWTPTSIANAPTKRVSHSAVWTGGQMVVWGGHGDFGDVNTGGRYDPGNDTWSQTTTVSAPSGRSVHTAVWTGSAMVVWGGATSFPPFGDGGSYDPVTDVWKSTSTINAPSARGQHSAVWTGALMLVFGGWDGYRLLSSGGRYSPATDSWTPTATNRAPSERVDHTAVWTGNQMIVWGGADNASFLGTGGRYDPVTDNWIPTAMTGAPLARSAHTAVWTGNRMIVWGGTNGSDGLSTGGRYDPITDSWTPTSTNLAPAGRLFHSAVWTGVEMVVWGGVNMLTTTFNSGGRYDPITNSWRRTSSVNAPSERSSHAAIWTGSQMVVWGGRNCTQLPCTYSGVGGRYDPGADSWLPTAMTNAPAARSFLTAIWTGDMMIVWGGESLGVYVNTGGRYSPRDDTWSPVTTLNAPPGRGGHTAVWAGGRMIVWGGGNGSQFLPVDTGARYDPQADVWFPMTGVGSPFPRLEHTAVWADGEMIVWGGYGYSAVTNTGGVYCPCASTFYHDFDGDGYGDPDQGLQACDEPMGYVENADDCNDKDASINMGRVERCNAIDDDCDMEVDEGFDVGSGCTMQVDACHQVVGTAECLADGTGTRCNGPTRFQDTAAPTLTCPSEVIQECPMTVGEIDVANATDTCDPSPVVSNDAPQFVPLGTTIVTWTATDASGNSASCQQTVRVQDTTPPVLTVFPETSTLWPPNHELVPVSVVGQVGDLCDPGPRVTLMSVSSSEPDDAPGTGEGNTTGDISGAEVGTADELVELRAERSASGPGRVYTLTYRAVDASGNTTPALAVVTVPHDQRQGPEPLLMRLEADETPGMVRLYWPMVAGATGYDVISGDLSQARVEDGHLSLGDVRVLARGTTEISLSEGDAGAIPPIGGAFFYLIQPRTNRGGAGYGTESAPWPRMPASCDGGCP